MKYKCKDCKEKFNGKKLKVCPSCNSNRISNRQWVALVLGGMFVFQSLIVFFDPGWQTDCSGGILSPLRCYTLSESEITMMYWLSLIFFVIGLLMIIFYMKSYIQNRSTKILETE